MTMRLVLAAWLFFGLAAFTADEKKMFASSCAASILKAKTSGAPVPADVVSNRNGICGCIADNVGRNPKIGDADKRKIAAIYSLQAEGKSKEAGLIHQGLPKSANLAMQEYTKACVRYFLKQIKTAPKGTLKSGKKTSSGKGSAPK